MFYVLLVLGIVVFLALLSVGSYAYIQRSRRWYEEHTRRQKQRDVD